jgi:hypothetical protein
VPCRTLKDIHIESNKPQFSKAEACPILFRKKPLPVAGEGFEVPTS